MRDAALTLDALMLGGYSQEALDFGAWVLRATASHPSQTQVLYGVSGERRLIEYELDHLPGYEDSKPVRVGNAASDQFQLDVFGELLDAAYRGRELTGLLIAGRLGAPDAACSPTWRRSGGSPTRASGRCAGPAATSPTPR